MTTSVVHAVVLGTVNGITEFLPISSSAHLTLIPWIFRWENPSLAFHIFLRLGALVAITLYFLPELSRALRGGIASILERRIGFDRDRLLFWWLLIGTLPGALLGGAFQRAVQESFGGPLFIAISLSAVGFLIFWVDDKFPTLRNFDDLHFSDAWWVGFAQACSVVPGISRSGAAMGMARRLGFNREDSARYAFLLGFPLLAGAILWDSHRLLELPGGLNSWPLLWSGFAASAIAGLCTIHFLLGFLRYRTLAIFCWYRIGLAAAIVLFSIFFRG